MDIGCGGGRYASILAPLSKEYIGLDISKMQIKLAKKKTRKYKNIKFICSSAEKIKLPSNSADVAISTWVISAMKGKERKIKALKEANRILKKEGMIYLVENDIGGEFEKIRGRYPDTAITKRYNDWIQKKGFSIAKRINTYFRFIFFKESRKIFSSIWGSEKGNMVKGKIIKHKIIIFKKKR